MKIKKVLLAIIVAICTIIGCTSCGAKKIGSTTETTPTVVVTRPDYGEDVKIHIISNLRDDSLNEGQLEELTNEWLAENRDKTILSIEFHFTNQSNAKKYGLILIVYRDPSATSTEQ